MTALHDLIRETREARGWSRAQLARSATRYTAGVVTECQVRSLERDSKPPSGSILFPVAVALGLEWTAVLRALGYWPAESIRQIVDQAASHRRVAEAAAPRRMQA